MPGVTRVINPVKEQCESLFGKNTDVCVPHSYLMSVTQGWETEGQRGGGWNLVVLSCPKNGCGSVFVWRVGHSVFPFKPQHKHTHTQSYTLPFPSSSLHPCISPLPPAVWPVLLTAKCQVAVSPEQPVWGWRLAAGSSLYWIKLLWPSDQGTEYTMYPNVLYL